MACGVCSQGLMMDGGSVKGKGKKVAAKPQKVAPKPKKAADKPKKEAKVDGRKLEARTVDELRERAAKLDIKGRANLKKAQLVSAIRQKNK